MKHKKAGRPKKPINEKKVKIAITLTPVHFLKTKGLRGDRCKTIEKALDLFFKDDTKMDKQQIIEALECLIYLIEKNTETIDISMPESIEYDKAVKLLAFLKNG